MGRYSEIQVKSGPIRFCSEEQVQYQQSYGFLFSCSVRQADDSVPRHFEKSAFLLIYLVELTGTLS